MEPHWRKPTGERNPGPVVSVSPTQQADARVPEKVAMNHPGGDSTSISRVAPPGDDRTEAVSNNDEDQACHFAVLEGVFVETEPGIVYIDRHRGNAM